MAALDSVERLTALLDSHRGTLHALPGVVATGVGQRRGSQGPQEIAVQVFVKSEDDVERVRHDATLILDGLQVEVIVSGEIIAGKG